MNCYHCGKEIVRAEDGITLDNLNWSHYECIVDNAVRNMDNEEWTMPKPLTVFDGKPVTGTTPHQLWEAIQHGAIICTSISKSIAMLRPADSDETCYVFWDECEQMSMPYASQSDASEAFSFYCANL